MRDYVGSHLQTLPLLRVSLFVGYLVQAPKSMLSVYC